MAMLADGLIDWTTLTAGTTMNLRSTGATIDVPSITSGGTQTRRAAQNVTFSQITTNGIVGDPGDVNVTSDNAAIVGGAINANGSSCWRRRPRSPARRRRLRPGRSGMTAPGLIDWTTLTAGTTMNLRSTGATIDLDTATSGGTQTLRALQNVTFNQLTTTGIAGDWAT